jgi:hypothetical protein
LYYSNFIASTLDLDAKHVIEWNFRVCRCGCPVIIHAGQSYNTQRGNSKAAKLIVAAEDQRQHNPADDRKGLRGAQSKAAILSCRTQDNLHDKRKMDSSTLAKKSSLADIYNVVQHPTRAQK